MQVCSQGPKNLIKFFFILHISGSHSLHTYTLKSFSKIQCEQRKPWHRYRYSTHKTQSEIMKVESCCSIPPLSLPLAPLPPSRVPVSSSQHAIVFQHSYPNTNRSSRNFLNLRCGYQRKDWNPNPEVDTRIHWDSPDEGWISSSSSSSSSPFSPSTSSKSSSALDDIVSDLVSQASDSHYE